MSLGLHVQQSSSWVQDAQQRICPLNRGLVTCIEGAVHEPILGIFNSTARGKPVSSIENIEELIVGKALISSIFFLVGSHLPREHGRECPVEGDKLLGYRVPFCVVGIEHGIGICSEAVDGIGQFPCEIE